MAVSFLKCFFLNDAKTFWFSDIFVNLVPFNYSERKKRIFKKIKSHFKRRIILGVSRKVWSVRHKIDIEEVLGDCLLKIL